MSRQSLIAMFASSVLVFGGCGDDDDDDAEGASTSIEATGSEFQFEPDSWSVPAGQPFTIRFDNAGSVEHEWAVIKLGDDLESEAEFAEDKILFEVEAIPAGESATEEFTIDDAGTYQVICGISTHFDAGMEGTLTVG